MIVGVCGAVQTQLVVLGLSQRSMHACVVRHVGMSKIMCRDVAVPWSSQTCMHAKVQAWRTANTYAQACSIFHNAIVHLQHVNANLSTAMHAYVFAVDRLAFTCCKCTIAL